MSVFPIDCVKLRISIPNWPSSLRATPPAATLVAVSRAEDRSSTLRTSVCPYLRAPARSAWPGLSLVTGFGAKPSLAAVISAVQFTWSLFSSTNVTGLPMVTPPRTPLTMWATSVSICCRPPRPWPPWRRARSRRRSSSEISSPAGRPSRITVSCGPCDSPAVSHLSIEAMIGAVPKALDVALIDVGGTLWPNSWPFRETDGAGRHQRVGAAMPALEAGQVDSLVADLIASSRIGDEARAISTETPATIAAAEVLIAASLERQGLPADLPTVARIGGALALLVADRMNPLPGAPELLAEIHELGLRTVIASNTYWRDAESYWDDFRLLGMADHIDAIVTSVDAGHLKPHPAVFEMAMRVADAQA